MMMICLSSIEYDHIGQAYQQLYWGVDEVNLSKLFEMQRKLDERIIKEKGLEGQDLLPNKILALQVELGELANEWRGFKHWSKDQKPRNNVEVYCDKCKGYGYIDDYKNEEFIDCEKCNGDGIVYENHLLEEYVDCLHFVLSIGLELFVNRIEIDWDVLTTDEIDIVNQFLEVMRLAEEVRSYHSKNDWWELFEEFYLLGEMLGFTWEQIEQAYIDENKVNHERQNNGY